VETRDTRDTVAVKVGDPSVPVVSHGKDVWEPLSQERESLKPIQGSAHPVRCRLNLRGELALALLPTATILAVLFLLEALSRQRLLFGSLASSAFLIYLDPTHGTNRVRTLAISHLVSMTVGLLAFWIFGHGYLAAGTALVASIFLMILLDVVHPPAVGTSLSFAFRVGAESDINLFVLALGVTATLVILQRASLWVLGRFASS
jgi:CBS-domain-containing membrane protein